MSTHFSNRSSLSDIPFNEAANDFGTDRYVKGLIRFIRHSSSPITIALQGEWGSGKTSLMTRLERVLCAGDSADFVGVGINTWEYSMMSSPEATVYKILVHLVRELTADDSQSKKTFKKYLRSAGNFLYRGARESLKTIPGVGGMIAVGLEAANVPTQLAENNEEAESVSLADLKRALEQAIAQRIEAESKKGVIIFVDDLDRLNPPVAVEILELLKNVFTLDHCIFVLAIDYDVVVKGLKPKFGELTERNEREFRSFFDKIIQVPFSLPVNSYRPMDFIMKSLVEIGYLKDFDAQNPTVRDLFARIVESSVGKNPRSIKRLINTLSLLDCIAQSGDENVESSMAEKQLNFIIVAIQICYPKIYKMLVKRPDFTSWNPDFAANMGIMVESDEADNTESDWEEILERACNSDPYLTQHFNDISSLLDLILSISSDNSADEAEDLGSQLRHVLDKSSVTGISSDTQAENLDRKALIEKLHQNIIAGIQKLRPEIDEIKRKKNTGNGGLYIRYGRKKDLEVTFSPSLLSDNKICLKITLNLLIPRTQELKAASFEEILVREGFADALAQFDSVIAPMLRDNWFFEGKTYDGQKSCFKSYEEELRHIHACGEAKKIITNSPQYYINLAKVSHFEEPQIIDAIARLLIAALDFRKETEVLWK